MYVCVATLSPFLHPYGLDLHSGTCGLSVASGSLRPFGPVSGSNVARCSSVFYLTGGDNVTPLYVSWDEYSSGQVSHALVDTRFECVHPPIAEVGHTEHSTSSYF